MCTVHRNYGTPNTMTQVIIDRVHEVAKIHDALIGVTFGDFTNKATVLDGDELNPHDDDDISDKDYKDNDTGMTENLTDTEPIAEITDNQIHNVQVTHGMLEEF